MTKWRFSAANPSLRTDVGEQDEDGIRVRGGRAGAALFGPYIDIPPGRLTARVRLAGARRGPAVMDLAADAGSRRIASCDADLGAMGGEWLELSADLDEPAMACEVRLLVGEEAQLSIRSLEIDLAGTSHTLSVVADRPVGYESSKTYADKIESGFLARYLAGPSVLELGYKGYYGGSVPIVPQAVGVDIGYPGYDGITLPFADGSFDAIYSSHCFEHIPDYVAVLRDWHRVLAVGGYLIIVVPHHHLFEKRLNLPSFANIDHKRFYTPASLLAEIEEAFEVNTYRVRHLADNDKGYDYANGPKDPTHGCFEIELVIEKLQKPAWNLDDGTLRPYSAREFLTGLPRSAGWAIETDFSQPGECLAWGPYVVLAPGRYEAAFHLDAVGLGAEPLAGDIAIDVAVATQTVVSRTLSGAEGAEALRAGVVTLAFEHPPARAAEPVEFRVYAYGRPFAGTLAFNGIVLAHPRS